MDSSLFGTAVALMRRRRSGSLARHSSNLALLAVVVAIAAFVTGTDAANAAGNSIVSLDTSIYGADSSIALDASGNPVLSYIDATNDDLKVLHCGDVTCTAGNTITSPDTAGDVGEYASMALDGAGNPVVSYYDATNSDLKVLHCGDPTCTASNMIASPDTADDVGRFTSLALDGAGYPVVSYYDATNDDLKVLHCGDPTCTASNTIASPDTVGSVGIYTSLALDGAGYPVVSYQDIANIDLKVLHCGNATCTGGNTITSPDTAGNVGAFTSLALDGVGRPVVSYLDLANPMSEDLKVLRCGNATCTSGNTIAAAATSGMVGWYSSLALGSGDRPVVSYWDITSDNLNVLRCDNPTCTTLITHASPDTVGSVGSQTSLTLDSGVRPVVSYFDYTNEDLKLLHCSDRNCLGVKETDGDGCPDVKEQQLAPGSELTGGLRDYLSPHDYFNPTQDGQNRVDDILLIVQAYFDDDDDGNPGLPPYEPGYDPGYDRTLVGPNDWNLGPPNGLQRVDDILNSVKQYFHDCS